MSQFTLLQTRRFAPFFGTQFLGAFNDNLFKNALVVLLTFQAASWTTLSAGLLANLAAGIFILPYFLFSATAGQLADKYDKAKLARLVKLLEMLIMGVAAAGFALHSLPVLFAALFLLGLHSTLFGPVKYAILPQHLRADELVGGNALVEAGTFVAILLGTLAGALLAGAGGDPVWVAFAGLFFAAVGYLSSRAIPAAPAPAPELVINLNPFSETWRNIGFARTERTVFLAILGISWFWLYGALFLAQFPAYTKNVLGGGETTVTLLLATFTVGIGLGSLLCERLSGKHVELGLVPFGSIGLSLFGLDLAFASPAALPADVPLALGEVLARAENWRVLFDLLGLGLFGGFFIVPLYALIQLRSPPAQRARIIAANNILNALFMVVGALAAAALLDAGVSIPTLFGIGALGNALLALYLYRRVPEFLLRFIVWLLVHSVYRLQQRGLENIPEKGPALLVCNHVTCVDALLITAACRRPIRFVIDHRLMRMPILRFVFRIGRAIPIASDQDDPALLARAFDEVTRALAAGELVGLFSEERRTDTGELQPFCADILRFLEHPPAPVVPLALRGSFFSHPRAVKQSAAGGLFSRLLRCRLFSKIVLLGAPPLAPSDATPERLQAALAELRGAFK